jgi:hypothetical protein
MTAVVLVTFYSRSGATETRALSLAVGAVQQRALIRLRRLPDRVAAAAGDADTIARMQKEYVGPTEADILGADAIVVAPTSGCDPDGAEWREYITLLRTLGAAGKLSNKVGAVVSAANGDTVAAFAGALLATGLVVVPPGATPANAATPAAATAHGRRVAAAARALKSE